MEGKVEQLGARKEICVAPLVSLPNRSVNYSLYALLVCFISFQFFPYLLYNTFTVTLCMVSFSFFLPRSVLIGRFLCYYCYYL